MQRRDLLKVLAGASLLQLKAAEPGAPLFFSKQEFATLNDLTEMLIPADSHSPGAQAAGVASFIDKTVAEAFLPEEKTSWRAGLAPYLKLNQAQRLALLSEAAAKEANPQTASEKFFFRLKEATVFAYYTSSVGIHQDIQYVGNVIQEQFSGYEVS